MTARQQLQQLHLATCPLAAATWRFLTYVLMLVTGSPPLVHHLRMPRTVLPVVRGTDAIDEPDLVQLLDLDPEELEAHGTSSERLLTCKVSRGPI